MLDRRETRKQFDVIREALPLLLLQHDANDLFVSLTHTVTRQLAYVADGVFHAFGHDAVAAVKLASAAFLPTAAPSAPAAAAARAFAS